MMTVSISEMILRVEDARYNGTIDDKLREAADELITPIPFEHMNAIFRSRERFYIADSLIRSNGLTPKDLMSYKFNKSKVYRHLNALIDAGLVYTKPFINDKTRAQFKYCFNESYKDNLRLFISTFIEY